MFLAMNNLEFGQWVLKERGDRGWSQSDLSRLSGLHRAVISKIESGTRPMPETLVSLAQAFKISPVTIFRLAGLLPPGPDDKINFEDWKYLLEKLTLDEREEMRQIFVMKIERRQKAEQTERAKNFKPKKSAK
jgi:transcriptional regulator with XRE-family HTH domain